MNDMKDLKAPILVWDAPVRVFHWMLVFCFAGAYITADGERWRLVHVTLGYTLGGLVAFRVLWGLWGTRYARFRNFVRGPGAVLQYGRALLTHNPRHYLGHNPAGAVAIVLLLLSSFVIVGTGWVIYNDMGAEWLGELHEGASSFMLALVGVHIAGVVVASRIHRENLVEAMVSGRKQGSLDEAIRWSWWPLALLIVVAVLGFWWLQWQGAPSGTSVGIFMRQVFNANTSG